MSRQIAGRNRASLLAAYNHVASRGSIERRSDIRVSTLCRRLFSSIPEGLGERRLMKAEAGIWILRSEAEQIGRHLAAKLKARLYAPVGVSQSTNRERFAGCFREHRQWVL